MPTSDEDKALATRPWRLRWQPSGSDQVKESTVYGDKKLDKAMRDLERANATHIAVAAP